MSYEILIGALGFIGALIVVVKPIIDLNTNITALTSSVNSLQKILDELKKTVDAHGDEMGEMRVKLENHDTRISALENMR